MTSILIVSADRSTGSGYAHNIGDALLTDALAKALTVAGASVVVADFGGERLPRGEPRLHLRGPLDLWRVIRSVDAVVIGGGTLLQDDVGRGLGGLPRLIAAVSWISRLARRRAYFFAVGCDPVDRPLARLLLRVGIWRRTVWVRDAWSAPRVRALGDREVRVGADAVLLWGADVFSSPSDRGAGAVVALARDEVRELDDAYIARLKELHTHVIFVQMDQGDERGDARSLPSDVRSMFDYVTERMPWMAVVDLYRNADVVVASRMHALYLGMMFGVPLVVASDRPKVRSFAEEFGLPLHGSVSMTFASAHPATVQEDKVRSARFRAQSALKELYAEIKKQ